jgi:putative transposase
MKKSRFTEAQIFGILNEQGSGLKVSGICRKHGISEATYHNLSADRQVGRASMAD